jgi:hypothetical protein
LFALALCQGCGGPLEKEHIPVLWSARLGGGSADMQVLGKEFIAIRQNNIGAPAIELLVQADTATGLPKINRLSLVYLSRLLPLLQGKDIPYTLILTHNFLHPLFLNAPPPAELWFSQYLRELQQLCKERLQSYPPQNLVLGSHFWAVEKEKKHWQGLIDSLKFYFSGKIGYATVPEAIPLIQFWEKLDFIGIHHPGGIRGEEKKFAQKWHPIITQIALRNQKPLMITQANLIGPDKLLQLQNRLRFWGNNVAFVGITINNIAPQTALSDTFAEYFGIAHDIELQKYLFQLNQPPWAKE